MSKEIDAHIYLTGDAARARATLHQAFEADGFRVEWNPDGWSGLAKKGNQALNILFGAFAQYHEIFFAFATMPDGNLHLRLYRQGSGIAGGLIGWSSVKKRFAQNVQRLEATFYQAGVLLGSQGY